MYCPRLFPCAARPRFFICSEQVGEQASRESVIVARLRRILEWSSQHHGSGCTCRVAENMPQRAHACRRRLHGLWQQSLLYCSRGGRVRRVAFPFTILRFATEEMHTVSAVYAPAKAQEY